MSLRSKLLLLFLLLFTSITSWAQSDSTYWDMGNLMVKKNQLQHVSIKGADLHRLPFFNWRDLISVYAGGEFTKESNILYIVDGIHAPNINQYSKFDVEELIIVWNSLLPHHIVNAERLHEAAVVTVIVKTNRAPKEKLAINFHASQHIASYQSTAKINDKFQPNLLHQYHLSLQYRMNKLTAGASFGLLNHKPSFEEMIATDIRSHNNTTYNQYKINGWVNYEISSRHALSASVYYQPDKSGSENFQTSAIVYSNGYDNNRWVDTRNNTLMPTIQLNSSFGKHFKNQFSGTGSLHKRATDVFLGMNFGSVMGSRLMWKHDSVDARRYVIRNYLRYNRVWGLMELAPSLDMQYQKLSSGAFSKEVSSSGNQGIDISKKQPWDGTFIGSMNGTEMWRRLFRITPAIEASYGKLATLTFGLVYDNLPISSLGSIESKESHTNPFITAAIQPLSLLEHPVEKVSLSLFASYSRQNRFYDVLDKTATASYWGDTYLYLPNYENGDKYNIAMFGMQLGGFNNKLIVSYNNSIENNIYNASVSLTPGMGGSSLFYNSLIKTTSHYIRFRSELGSENSFLWKWNLHAATQSAKLTLLNASTENALPSPKKDKAIWSGGFVNYFSVKRFIAGCSFVYDLNRNFRMPGFPGNMGTPSTVFIKRSNSFQLQQLYAGITVPSTAIGAMEVYCSGQNLWQSKKDVFTNSQFAYYGIGLNLTWK